MAGGWLNFDLPRPDWLNFGRTATPANELSIAGSLPALSGSFVGYSGITLRRDSAMAWADAQRLAVDTGVPWQAGQRQQATIKAVWASGQRTAMGLATPWAAGARQGRATGVPWDCTASGLITTALPWRSGDRAITMASAAWRAGSRQSLATALGWAAGLRWATQLALPWQSGQRIQGGLTLAWSIPIVARRIIWLCWDQARRPRNRWRAPPYQRPDSGKRAGRLNFVCFKPGNLDFGLRCFGAGVLFPALRRSYRVLNSASLIRVADGLDLPCSAITVALDRDSWSWTLAATLLTRAAHDAVPAFPGTVRATLNGFAWDFVVDDLTYNRRFGQFTAQLTGRSIAACYAEPYALTTSYREAELRTAQQLILQELGEGWAMDWDPALSDWTIPGNTFQYDNLSPIEAMIRVAKATGARLYADASDRVIHVAPRWPVKPWAWQAFTPDVSLPSSYALTEVRKFAAGAEYESVLITGGADGIAVLATRAGTGGATHAPSQLDRLITDVEPAKMLAIATLADQWPLRHYQIDLPLQAAPGGAGLLLPGSTVDFVDGENDGWRGLIVGVSISASRTEIRQTIEAITP